MSPTGTVAASCLNGFTDRPELYDAIQSEWPYDPDVSFVLPPWTATTPAARACSNSAVGPANTHDGFDADDRRTVFVTTS